MEKEMPQIMALSLVFSLVFVFSDAIGKGSAGESPSLSVGEAKAA